MIGFNDRCPRCGAELDSGGNCSAQCQLYTKSKKHTFIWWSNNFSDLPPEGLPCNCGKKKIKYKVIVIDRNSY